jgi:hypothetical protein
MEKAPPSICKWIQTLELGYWNVEKPPDGGICFHCAGRHAKLLKCARCKVATYCQRDCQVEDWKIGKHKLACQSYARVGPSMQIDDENDKQQACNELFGRIRFYVCPYAVHKATTLGRGFLFIQSDRTLATMSLTLPKDSYGRPTDNRALLIYYLTLGEFDAEVCREDFEMATVRTKLQEAVENYDEEDEIVILMRFRCGHVSLGTSALVPDHRVCKKLGIDYYSESTAAALQLNIDDS